jgi:hypothetical protein
MSSSKTVRIACGSASAEDRIDLAVEMTDRGDIQYLCMDGLAERTLALAHQRRDPTTGRGAYDTRLPEVASDVLPLAVKRRVKIVCNFGAANPADAGAYLAKRARELGLSGVKVAVIEGDDVARYVTEHDPIVLETGEPVSRLPGTMVAANAYIGAVPILEALRMGATVVVGGRLADPSLFVGPIAYELGWDLNDWTRIGAATVVGHLLECGIHVTGGNFADPPYRVVESFEHLSHPLAEVRDDGSAYVAKLPNTDGLLSVETCKMQLGYEIGDPSRYITPDVIADFRNVTLAQSARGIEVSGGTGRQWPAQLKALVAIDEGFIGEGQVSFAGPGAVSRARLSSEIVRARVQPLLDSGQVSELKVDLLGIDSMLGPASAKSPDPNEVHLRVAGRAKTQREAELVANACWQLQLSGPAAIGGHRKLIKPVVGMYSFFLPREVVRTTVRLVSEDS